MAILIAIKFTALKEKVAKVAKGENVIRKWAGKLKDTKSLDIFASVKGIFGWRLSSPCGPAKRQANSESEKCHKRTLKQDLIQNAMVVINGSLAIVFADRYTTYHQ